MTNNEFLRRLRFALNLDDATAASCFSLAPGSELTIDEAGFRARIADDDDAHYCELKDSELAAFLDGLIIHKRGLKDDAQTQPTANATRALATVDGEIKLSKNEILKKLRIALSLHEEHLLGLLKVGGKIMSKGELSALFRNASHTHYRPAGNQVVRALLKGLTRVNREKKSQPD